MLAASVGHRVWCRSRYLSIGALGPALRPLSGRAQINLTKRSPLGVQNRELSLSTARWQQDAKVPEVVEGAEQTEVEEDDYSERYIPITRRSLIHNLTQERDFLTREERGYYEEFATALDAAIVNQYHGILQELKMLFDPINPDKDTVETRQWNPRERQDNEFWLLRRLDDVMEKANFYEIPQEEVDRCLQEHRVGDGVMVSVDPSKYDVLKFWALGRQTVHAQRRWYNVFSKQQGEEKPNMYYKRVVVAMRLKRDQKLVLKSFKEIPVNSLEMILPDGNVKITKFDKGLIGVSLFIASVGVVAKAVTVLASLKVDVFLLVSGAFGLTALRAWMMYSNRKNKYLMELSRVLYFKNVANNRGLLALLVDRAQDETYKEALLVYTFLLANRPKELLQASSMEMSPEQLGGIGRLELEDRITSWVHHASGIPIEFDCSEAIQVLQNFGILSETDNKLNVLPLKAAHVNLPRQPHSLSSRALDVDFQQGYDRDAFAESEEQYVEKDKLQKMIGWR